MKASIQLYSSGQHPSANWMEAGIVMLVITAPAGNQTPISQLVATLLTHLH
jgi:hypothetical protein